MTAAICVAMRPPIDLPPMKSAWRALANSACTVNHRLVTRFER